MHRKKTQEKFKASALKGMELVLGFAVLAVVPIRSIEDVIFLCMVTC